MRRNVDTVALNINPASCLFKYIAAITGGYLYPGALQHLISRCHNTLNLRLAQRFEAAAFEPARGWVWGFRTGFFAPSAGPWFFGAHTVLRWLEAVLRQTITAKPAPHTGLDVDYRKYDQSRDFVVFSIIYVQIALGNAELTRLYLPST